MLKAIKVLFTALDTFYEEIAENEIAVPVVALSIPENMSELLPMDSYPSDLPLFDSGLSVHIKEIEGRLNWLIVVPNAE